MHILIRINVYTTKRINISPEHFPCVDGVPIRITFYADIFR